MFSHALTPHFAAADFLSARFLFASLLWSSVGCGYWIYGKRRSAMSAMLGGVAMIAISCLVASALLMSALCLVVVGAVYVALQRSE